MYPVSISTSTYIYIYIPCTYIHIYLVIPLAAFLPRILVVFGAFGPGSRSSDESKRGRVCPGQWPSRRWMGPLGDAVEKAGEFYGHLLLFLVFLLAYYDRWIDTWIDGL